MVVSIAHSAADFTDDLAAFRTDCFVQAVAAKSTAFGHTRFDYVGARWAAS